MTSKELIESWKRTETFLLDARAHLSEAAEGICADEITEFDEYLNHNELELALDMLDTIFKKTGVESWRVIELMAKAAASMKLFERQRGYDEKLSKARGWVYKTIIE
jgi:hypothetical protein